MNTIEVEFQMLNGQVEKLVVSPHDDPQQVSEEFVKRHGIQAKIAPLMAERIAESIKQNSKDVLQFDSEPTKISAKSLSNLRKDPFLGIKEFQDDNLPNFSSIGEVHSQFEQNVSQVVQKQNLEYYFGNHSVQVSSLQDDNQEPRPRISDASLRFPIQHQKQNIENNVHQRLYHDAIHKRIKKSFWKEESKKTGFSFQPHLDGSCDPRRIDPHDPSALHNRSQFTNKEGFSSYFISPDGKSISQTAVTTVREKKRSVSPFISRRFRDVNKQNLIKSLKTYFTWQEETKEVRLEEAFKAVRVQKLLTYLSVSGKPISSLSGHYKAVLIDFLQGKPQILEEAEKV